MYPYTTHIHSGIENSMNWRHNTTKTWPHSSSHIHQDKNHLVLLLLCVPDKELHIQTLICIHIKFIPTLFFKNQGTAYTPPHKPGHQHHIRPPYFVQCCPQPIQPLLVTNFTLFGIVVKVNQPAQTIVLRVSACSAGFAAWWRGGILCKNGWARREQKLLKWWYHAEFMISSNDLS